VDAQVIARQKPRVIADTHQDKDWVVLPETAWIRSNITLPLVGPDGVLGVLRIDSEEVNRFSEDDAQTLMPFAIAAALVLKNLQLYSQAQQEIEKRREAQIALESSNQALEQRVAAREDVDEHKLDDGFLSENHPADFIFDRGDTGADIIHASNDSVVRRLQHTIHRVVRLNILRLPLKEYIPMASKDTTIATLTIAHNRAGPSMHTIQDLNHDR